jgi:hypothetical protein
MLIVVTPNWIFQRVAPEAGTTTDREQQNENARTPHG